MGSSHENGARKQGGKLLPREAHSQSSQETRQTVFIIQSTVRTL